MTASTAAAHALMTGVLDEDDALALLEQVVNEKGADHTVQNCVYFDISDEDLENDPDAQGDPVCIVGHVLDKLGKGIRSLSVVSQPHWASAGLINDATIDDIAVEGLVITQPASDLLRAAQKVQDGRISPDISWGHGLRAAHEARTANGLAVAA